MMISRQCCAMVALCVLAATAAAQGVDHAREYEACIALTFRDADEALSAAQAWQKRGGGLPAEHCAALALLEAGRLEAAAQRLEAMASRLPPSGGPDPTEVLAQAANVWLLAGKTERALGAIDLALQGDPLAATLLIDRARILAEMGEYERALEDLDTAAGEAPEDDDLAAFRAAALRRLGRFDAAVAEAERARLLNPGNSSAGLELGLSRLQAGDLDGARAALEETAERFAGTPAGDAAARQLARMGRGKDAQ